MQWFVVYPWALDRHLWFRFSWRDRVSPSSVTDTVLGYLEDKNSTSIYCLDARKDYSRWFNVYRVRVIHLVNENRWFLHRHHCYLCCTSPSGVFCPPIQPLCSTYMYPISECANSWDFTCNDKYSRCYLLLKKGGGCNYLIMFIKCIFSLYWC